MRQVAGYEIGGRGHRRLGRHTFTSVHEQPMATSPERPRVWADVLAGRGWPYVAVPRSDPRLSGCPGFLSCSGGSGGTPDSQGQGGWCSRRAVRAPSLDPAQCPVAARPLARGRDPRPGGVSTGQVVWRETWPARGVFVGLVLRRDRGRRDRADPQRCRASAIDQDGQVLEDTFLAEITALLELMAGLRGFGSSCGMSRCIPATVNGPPSGSAARAPLPTDRHQHSSRADCLARRPAPLPCPRRERRKQAKALGLGRSPSRQWRSTSTGPKSLPWPRTSYRASGTLSCPPTNCTRPP